MQATRQAITTLCFTNTIYLFHFFLCKDEPGDFHSCESDFDRDLKLFPDTIKCNKQFWYIARTGGIDFVSIFIDFDHLHIAKRYSQTSLILKGTKMALLSSEGQSYVPTDVTSPKDRTDKRKYKRNMHSHILPLVDASVSLSPSQISMGIRCKSGTGLFL